MAGAGALLLAAFLLALLLLTPPDGSAGAAHTRPGTRSTADVPASLYENFAVLRQPRSRSDVLPSRPKPMGDCDPAQSRLVADSDGVKAWIVPGPTSVCLTIRSASGWASQAGGRVETTATYRSGRRPLGSLNVGSMSWKPYRRLLTMVFPDGTSNVRLRRGTRVVRTLTVTNNAVQTRPRSATSIWWSAPDGTQRHLTLH